MSKKAEPVLPPKEESCSYEEAIARSMIRYPNATCANCGAIIPEGSSSIFCCNCNQGKK